MTSPVFKAMLSSDFKEKDATEIALVGKKADQFIDFLRQMYPPQIESEITRELIVNSRFKNTVLLQKNTTLPLFCPLRNFAYLELYNRLLSSSKNTAVFLHCRLICTGFYNTNTFKFHGLSLVYMNNLLITRLTLYN
jgi:hypothetical protein